MGPLSATRSNPRCARPPALSFSLESSAWSDQSSPPNLEFGLSAFPGRIPNSRVEVCSKCAQSVCLCVGSPTKQASDSITSCMRAGGDNGAPQAPDPRSDAQGDALCRATCVYAYHLNLSRCLSAEALFSTPQDRPSRLSEAGAHWLRSRGWGLTGRVGAGAAGPGEGG